MEKIGNEKLTLNSVHESAWDLKARMVYQTEKAFGLRHLLPIPKSCGQAAIGFRWRWIISSWNCGFNFQRVNRSDNLRWNRWAMKTLLLVLDINHTQKVKPRMVSQANGLHQLLSHPRKLWSSTQWFLMALGMQHLTQISRSWDCVFNRQHLLVRPLHSTPPASPTASPGGDAASITNTIKVTTASHPASLINENTKERTGRELSVEYISKDTFEMLANVSIAPVGSIVAWRTQLRKIYRTRCVVPPLR